MPKDKKVGSFSFDRSRVVPYPHSSTNDKYKSKSPSSPVRDEEEWEEARCPICMEHPHNAVLLLCSSREKGCLTYMCDTSYRHSNCLDQFCKSSAAQQSTAQSEGVPLSSQTGNRQAMPRFCGGEQSKLVCPLCRGQVKGWVVIKPARQFMNFKLRSCSLETCGFSGSYSELRRHARLEHPSIRPSEADPRRQHDWTRMERQTDFEDFLSAYRLESGDEWTEDGILPERDWMVLEHERDLEDILGAINSESDDDWNVGWSDLSDGWSDDSMTSEYDDELGDDDNLLMDFECELPLPFVQVFEPCDSWVETSELGSPRDRRQSRDRRSTRSRTT